MLTATMSSSWRWGSGGERRPRTRAGWRRRCRGPGPQRPPSEPITFYGVTRGRDSTTAEVAERVAAGKVNQVDDSSSRSLGEIVRSNVFTRFNALDRRAGRRRARGRRQPRDALFAVVMVLNAVIGIVQELRSKATLDRLSVVAAPRLTVVRDGERGRGRAARTWCSTTSSCWRPATSSSSTGRSSRPTSCRSTSRC